MKDWKKKVESMVAEIVFGTDSDEKLIGFIENQINWEKTKLLEDYEWPLKITLKVEK